ncbi:hypothetical protein H8B02_08615 [Bradyrhizobium sp. Pear77]|uniref:hypothetical protein n=1 Tax=Bradyrhizobium altum TaxID=1571202 RepID=UPI001E37C21B|nr:hypothetical protein [Bradyrhizobium altum]MCC8953515.1 hypothetical protein [Bradyrhizobium altum]
MAARSWAGCTTNMFGFDLRQAQAYPFTLMSDDLPAAARFIDMLLDRSGRNGLTIWHVWATCFKGIHLIKSGSATEGLALVERTLARIPPNRFSLRYAWVIGEQADGLRRAKRIPQGLVVIDQALSLSARDEERWCVCELLRIKAELLMAQGGAKALEAAERCLVESLDWARKQGALSWESRTTLSLYRLQASRGRQANAISKLRTVFARFDQGFGTTDLLEASKTKALRAIGEGDVRPGRALLPQRRSCADAMSDKRMALEASRASGALG